jgi:hypothetical protein
LLCTQCEGLFSQWETEFAKHIFHPLHENEALRLGSGPWFEYGPWCLQFAVSISWRCLEYMRAVGGLKHFDASQQIFVEKALNTWRQFLIGESDNPGNCEQHMILFDRIADHTCDNLPNNLNRYLLRTVDCDAIRNGDSAIVYVKMCRVMLFGFICELHKNRWQGTKLHLRKGKIGGADVALPGPLLNYFNARARKVMALDRNLSPRQLEKIRAESERNIERIVGSESFAAGLYDIELFGMPD